MYPMKEMDLKHAQRKRSLWKTKIKVATLLVWDEIENKKEEYTFFYNDVNCESDD